MRKVLVVFLALAMVAGLTAVAGAADRYDRYERYEGGDAYPPPPPPPPPRRGAEVPPPRHATYGQTYFFAHLGIFDPNNEAPTPTGGGLDGYDGSGAFDLGIGSRVSPFLAVDGTVGGYSADRGSDEVTVVPVTVGLRLILPHPVIEPYVGLGGGLYSAKLKEPGIDDSDTTFGGYASVGLDAWLNPRVALNFEGKYHWVEPTFDGIDVNVGGWTMMLGVRVAF